MIKVNYDKETTIVKGYYPNSINYTSIPEPFIEIEDNEQILDKQMCVVNGVYKEYIKPLPEQLQDAKEAKIAQLKVNLDNASKKPFLLNGVKQIDKDGKVIGTVNASFNIYDGSSLTNAENIIFAGSIMKIQAFLRLFCVAIGKDFDAIKAQVNALSDNPNPEIAIKSNIPYTTKDINNKEIRVLLSFQKIEEIFAHIFTRVATKTNLFNIIEDKIKKATSIEELNKIDINLD